MPAAVRMFAHHSKGRGVLVGAPVLTLELENLHFLGLLVGEPVHHTQAVAARIDVDACSSADAIVRMPIRGTVHVSLGGELPPRHLPQFTSGPSVTGHGAPLDIFPRPSKLYPSEGEWAQVRPGVGSPGSGVWTVQSGQGRPRSPQMAQSAKGNRVLEA